GSRPAPRTLWCCSCPRRRPEPAPSSFASPTPATSRSLHWTAVVPRPSTHASCTLSPLASQTASELSTHDTSSASAPSLRLAAHMRPDQQELARAARECCPQPSALRVAGRLTLPTRAASAVHGARPP